MGFADRVYELTKKVPKGRVTTYKEIGRALGRKGQVYRAVGAALKNNKNPIVIPCHRVVNSDGTVGGYSGARNSKKKRLLLQKEGIKIKNNKIVDFEKALYRFR